MRANQFHDKFDLLLTPTLPITAFNIGLEIPENSDYDWWPEWVVFCYPFTLLGNQRIRYLAASQQQNYQLVCKSLVVNLTMYMC